MNYCQRIRDTIDEIDGAPFGQVGKLLDRMTEDATQAAAQWEGLLGAFQKIRLWLAAEGCDDPLEIADDALRGAGVTDVACPCCQGDGEWDEGPLPATSSAQIDPEYQHVKCPECNGSGRSALAQREPLPGSKSEASQ